MINKEYQRIIVALDTLTPAELVALLGEVSVRLQLHVGLPEETPSEETDETSRRYLPRMPQMIAWGLVVPMEDTLYVRDHADQPALLLDANRVAYQGETINLNDWAKHITGWKAVNVYEWVMVKRKERTLDDLRRAYLAENPSDG